MPLWKVAKDGPTKVPETKLKEQDFLEKHLEDWVVADPSLLGEPLLVIGRQVMVPELKDRLDVLALDPSGNAVIIELKRGKLKDPVDMQALRYASYISKWQYQDFEDLARHYLKGTGKDDFNFTEIYERFCEEAGHESVADVNADQRIIIVGSQVVDRLGSVGLWLNEHGVDVKIIDLELFKEGDTLLLQPHVVVPLPVSSFSRVGVRRRPSGSEVWMQDGMAWHLEKRCSPDTKARLLQIDEMLKENCQVDGPKWTQKNYIAYQIEGYNWLMIHTSPTVLRLSFFVKPKTFDGEELAKSLGVKVFDKEEDLSEKLGLPSSVYVVQTKEANEKVVLRVKDDFDLTKAAFLNFLQKARQAFYRE